jgi:hypothetical protein
VAKRKAAQPGKSKENATAAAWSRGLPCLIIIVGGLALVFALFYLALTANQ